MAVTEIYQKLGSFELRLRGNIPREVLDGIQYFGHIAVIPGRVDPRVYGDGILGASRYVGVVRKLKVPNDAQEEMEQDRLDITGVGMNFWLGDDEDKGRVIENELQFINANFSTAISGVMPPSVTYGNIGGVSGTYSGIHQWQTPRKAIQYICDTMSQAPTTPNLIVNGSFEVDSTGWVANNCNMAVTGAASYLGTKSLMVTALDTTTCQVYTATSAHNPDVTEGEEYTLSYWILPQTSGCTARIAVNFRTAADAFVSSAPDDEYIALTPNSWNQVSRKITVPTGTSVAQIAFICEMNQVNTGDKFFIDNVSTNLVIEPIPVSFRVNNDGSLDAGPESDLFVTNPTCVIVKRGSSPGEDMANKTIPGNLDLTQDYESFATRVVILAQSDGEQFSVGTADIGTVSPGSNVFKDLFGNPLAMTRMVSESNTVDDNADPRAHLALRETLNPHRDIVLSTNEYDVYGAFNVGDYVYAYDPDTNLYDNDNEVYVRGARFNPIKLRVTESEWPVTEDYSVGYRSADGVWYDLTDYVEWDTNLDTKVTIGDLERVLQSDFQNVEDRLGQIIAPDSTYPLAPAWIPANFQTVNYIDSQGNAKARQKLVWTVPTNTDLTNITDGDHYEIQYKLDTASLYSQTWAAVSTLTWNDISDNTWNQPVEPDDVEWQTILVPWGETSTVIHELPVGTGFDSRIRAVDKSNNQGAWSAEETWITSEDNIPPSTPEAPAVFSSTIAIQVIHTLGKASGGTYNLENDLAFLEVHYSQDNNFFPSETSLAGRVRADRGMMSSNNAAVATFTVPETSDIWVRVIAVDTGGNRSQPSVAVQAVPGLVDDEHISSLTVSKLTAGELSAAVILSGSIKTAEEGQRVEMNFEGIQAYNADGDQTINISASPSATGEFFSLRGVTGDIVAGISSGGDGTFDNVYADTEVFIGGMPLTDIMNTRSKGIVAYGHASVGGSGVNTTTELGIVELAFTAEENRTYKIVVPPVWTTITSSAYAGLYVRDGGTGTPNLSSNVLAYSLSIQTEMMQNIEVILRCGTGYELDPGLHRLLVSLYVSGSGTAVTTGDLGNLVQMYVEDCGPLITNTGISNIGTGPTGSPVTQYTKTYSSTATRSYYDWLTTRITNGRMYQGYFSDTYGNQRSLVQFNSATIQADLAGATILHAELTLKNDHFYYDEGGNLILGTHDYTTIPSTWNDDRVNWVRETIPWARYAKKTITLPSAIANEFKTGVSTGIAIGPSDTGEPDDYGYWAGQDSSNKPVLTFTYTK